MNTPPPFPAPSGVRLKTGLGTASLVLGLLSFLPCLPFLTGLPAVITGHIARRRAKKHPEIYSGGGRALAGLIMGYLSIPYTVVLAVLAAVALPALAVALPELARNKGRSQSVSCVNNLKQIGLAFRLWAGDNGDKYPFNVSTAKGGTLERCDRGSDGYDRNSFQHFLVMTNELGTPKILVCPSDQTKSAALKFGNLQPENVSYQVRPGPKVDETNPEEILIYCPIHQHRGLADGSVQAGKKY